MSLHSHDDDDGYSQDEDDPETQLSDQEHQSEPEDIEPIEALPPDELNGDEQQRQHSGTPAFLKPEEVSSSGSPTSNFILSCSCFKRDRSLGREWHCTDRNTSSSRMLFQGREDGRPLLSLSLPCSNRLDRDKPKHAYDRKNTVTSLKSNGRSASWTKANRFPIKSPPNFNSVGRTCSNTATISLAPTNVYSIWTIKFERT